MLIYNGIITLDYNPATDILVTSMPDVRQFGLSEVSFTLGLIVDHIRNYDIKNLLLDASKSSVDVDDDAYKTVTTKFGTDLMGTRLRKIARIVTQDAQREERSAKLSLHLRQELNLPIAFRNFGNHYEAMEWLLEK